MVAKEWGGGHRSYRHLQQLSLSKQHESRHSSPFHSPPPPPQNQTHQAGPSATMQSHN